MLISTAQGLRCHNLAHDDELRFSQTPQCFRLRGHQDFRSLTGLAHMAGFVNFSGSNRQLFDLLGIDDRYALAARIWGCSGLDCGGDWPVRPASMTKIEDLTLLCLALFDHLEGTSSLERYLT